MSPSDVAAAVGGLGALVIFLMWFAVVVAALLFPFALFSMARSLKRISRELERANDYREHYDHGLRPGPLGT
jgi:uncharacterized BrkB/YihY/UPF0761 family membrane protein